MIILMIAVPLYTLFAICFGVWLGHKLTLKAFAHVQPSTADMAKSMQMGTVTTEPDYIDEAYEEPPVELSSDEESALRKKFKEQGIPDEIWEHYKRVGKHPKEFLGYDVPYAEQGVEEELEKESIQ